MVFLSFLMIVKRSCARSLPSRGIGFFAMQFGHPLVLPNTLYSHSAHVQSPTYRDPGSHSAILSVVLSSYLSQRTLPTVPIYSCLFGRYPVRGSPLRPSLFPTLAVTAAVVCLSPFPLLCFLFTSCIRVFVLSRRPCHPPFSSLHRSPSCLLDPPDFVPSSPPLRSCCCCPLRWAIEPTPDIRIISPHLSHGCFCYENIY